MKVYRVGAMVALVVFLVLVGLAFTSGQANASPGSIVYVENHGVSLTNWPVKRAINWIDRRTPTKNWEYGKCRPGQGCIKLYPKSDAQIRARYGSGASGLTIYGQRTYGDPIQIWLNKKYRYSSDSVQMKILVHEFGHGAYLGHYNRPCNTTMCGTSGMFSVPLYFSPAQIRATR